MITLEQAAASGVAMSERAPPQGDERNEEHGTHRGTGG